MRGTALVVLLCVCAAMAAHVLTEEARARSIAAEEMCEPDDVTALDVAAPDAISPDAISPDAISPDVPADCAAAAAAEADGFAPPLDVGR